MVDNAENINLEDTEDTGVVRSSDQRAFGRIATIDLNFFPSVLPFRGGVGTGLGLNRMRLTVEGDKKTRRRQR